VTGGGSVSESTKVAAVQLEMGGGDVPAIAKVVDVKGALLGYKMAR
jgi:hypothetical protein